jgi:predicted TIM-barrel fold metal-dependent hydrolase
MPTSLVDSPDKTPILGSWHGCGASHALGRLLFGQLHRQFQNPRCKDFTPDDRIGPIQSFNMQRKRRVQHVWVPIAAVSIAALLLNACNQSRPPAQGPAIDPEIAAEIGRIRAIDHHAHPVRVVGEGEQDREFDALPVDNMEPSSDPIYLRPGNPGVIEAWRALFAYPYSDGRQEHLGERQSRKRRVIQEKGDGYPAWVLDQMGVAVMFANRVEMGRGIQPPRFLWVPYADTLMFPLNNSRLAERNSDRKAFFALEDQLLRRYSREAGVAALPTSLGEYLSRVVTPTLERHKRGGAVAEKFEAAYLRTLDFDKVEPASAERMYTKYVGKDAPPDGEYKMLQDYLFRYLAAECGRLGMAVHLHTMAGAGSYFDVQGANPLLLESILNDPGLRKTNFVMVHGGWPFSREITPLLEKPNAYLDFSAQSLLLPPPTLALSLREWLEWVPEKVMFGTDAYPFSDEMGWEEAGWLAARRGREALALALTAMIRDDEIPRDRALELARMVLRENAQRLYGLSNIGN